MILDDIQKKVACSFMPLSGRKRLSLSRSEAPGQTGQAALVKIKGHLADKLEKA